eukprot:7447319-Karenia_brevis.AAC.1
MQSSFSNTLQYVSHFLGGSKLQDEAKMASYLEVGCRLGSKLGGLGALLAPGCNIWVQFDSRLEVLKPSWLIVGGPLGYVGSKLGG